MHDLLQESFNLYQYPTSPQDIVEAVRAYADANYIQLLPDVNGADAAQDRRALQSGLLSLTRAMKSNTAPPAELDDASEGMAEAYRMALATATRDARTATTAMLAFSATLPVEEQGVYRTMLRSDARDCIQTGVGRILAHLATLAESAQAGELADSLKAGQAHMFLATLTIKPQQDAWTGETMISVVLNWFRVTVINVARSVDEDLRKSLSDPWSLLGLALTRGAQSWRRDSAWFGLRLLYQMTGMNTTMSSDQKYTSLMTQAREQYPSGKAASPPAPHMAIATFSDATTANTIAAAIFNPGGAGDGGDEPKRKPRCPRCNSNRHRLSACLLPQKPQDAAAREAMKKNASQFSVDRAGRDWGFDKHCWTCSRWGHPRHLCPNSGN